MTQSQKVPWIHMNYFEKIISLQTKKRLFKKKIVAILRNDWMNNNDMCYGIYYIQASIPLNEMLFVLYFPIFL